MALTKENGRFVVRFELSLFGMFSLTVVTACIFLWMFIIGIWAGQTILQPVQGEERKIANSSLAAQDQVQVAAIGQAVFSETNQVGLDKNASSAFPANQEPAAELEKAWTATEPSFFALQVSAVREQEKAQQELAQWRSKGYDAFVVTPENKEDPFIRIYVGRFDKLTEANKMDARLEKEEKVKAYIALLPASKLKTR